VPFIDDETDRVRADIEHGNGLRTLDSALRGRIGVNAPKFIQSLVSSVSRGKALPRPERLACVMK